MTTFVLPDLGEGLQEAEIVAWHVAEGDHVVADQPLVSVETEKAVVEVPSPQAGRIARLLGKVGDRVKVGAALVEFEEGVHADVGAVVGELTGHPLSPAPAKLPAMAPKAATVKAAPAARALARELGVDLARVTPTGPGGSVTRGDIAAAAGTGAQPPTGGGEALTGVRRSMALNMARAHAAVVPATLFDQADVETWWSPTADVDRKSTRLNSSHH